MSQSATPATRNEATTRLKPPKRTTSAKLPIGTAIRGSRGRLRTVADGCDHKRDVERTHPQPPDPQSESGTLATHSGKTKYIITSHESFYSLGCSPAILSTSLLESSFRQKIWIAWHSQMPGYLSVQYWMMMGKFGK